MARLTSRQKQEIVSTFYGINPETLHIESISMTREGQLSRRGIGVSFHTHVIPHGKTPLSEISAVYGLDQVIEIQTLLWNDEGSKRQVDELRAMAATMRADRDTSKTGRDG